MIIFWLKVNFGVTVILILIEITKVGENIASTAKKLFGVMGAFFEQIHFFTFLAYVNVLFIE